MKKKNSFIVSLIILLLGSCVSKEEMICPEYTTPDNYIYKTKVFTVRKVISIEINEKTLDKLDIIHNKINADTILNINTFNVDGNDFFKADVHSKCKNYTLLGFNLMDTTILKFLPPDNKIDFLYTYTSNNRISILCTIKDSSYYNRCIFSISNNHQKVNWTMFEDDSQETISWDKNTIVDTSAYPF